MLTQRRFLLGVTVGVLGTICVLSLLVVLFGFDATVPTEQVSSAPLAVPTSDTPAAGASGGCLQVNAEAVVQARVANMSPLGDAQMLSADWQEAGRCSWLVSGVGGWQDPLSNEVVSHSFSAAVSGENGRYRLDLFNITN